MLLFHVCRFVKSAVKPNIILINNNVTQVFKGKQHIHVFLLYPIFKQINNIVGLRLELVLKITHNVVPGRIININEI